MIPEAEAQLVIFKEGTGEIHEDLKSKLNQKKLQISQTQKMKFQVAISSIKEWKAEDISLSLVYSKFFLKELHHISFPCLKIINLGGNKIQSIDILPRINMPLIQRIFLWENAFITISPLLKMSPVGQFDFILHRTNTLDWEKITKFSFKTEKLKYLMINVHNDERNCRSINWVLKLPVELGKIYIRSKRMIAEKHTQEILKKKNEKIQFFHSQTMMKI